MPDVMLARLVRYEHVQVSLDDPRFTAAMADFPLVDLTGKR
jgi:hypothetical protein